MPDAALITDLSVADLLSDVKTLSDRVDAFTSALPAMTASLNAALASFAVLERLKIQSFLANERAFNAQKFIDLTGLTNNYARLLDRHLNQYCPDQTHNGTLAAEQPFVPGKVVRGYLSTIKQETFLYSGGRGASVSVKVKAADGTVSTQKVRGDTTPVTNPYFGKILGTAQNFDLYPGYVELDNNHRTTAAHVSYLTGYYSQSGTTVTVDLHGYAPREVQYSQNGLVITVSAIAHGYVVGAQVNVVFASGTLTNLGSTQRLTTPPDGIYTITAVIDANTFTVNAPPGSGSSLRTGDMVLENADGHRFVPGNLVTLYFYGVSTPTSGDYTVVAVPSSTTLTVTVASSATRAGAVVVRNGTFYPRMFARPVWNLLLPWRGTSHQRGDVAALGTTNPIQTSNGEGGVSLLPCTDDTDWNGSVYHLFVHPSNSRWTFPRANFTVDGEYIY